MAVETITYTSGLTGASITLGDASLSTVVYNGIKGHGMSPVDNFAVDTAYQPGAQFLRTKKKPAVITLSVIITGDPTAADQRASFWSTVDQLSAVLEPSITTAGTLVKTDSLGVQRKLTNVQYVGGLEIDDKAANRAYAPVSLIFEAYDPLWYSISSYSQVVGASSDPFGFAVPITIPLTVNGQAKGTATVTNHGNVYSKPQFTFTGPLQNFSVTNLTTNESFAISQTLNAGDTLVVDTLYGSITYTPAGGSATPLYSAFSGARQWIRLAPGANTIQFLRDVAGNQQLSVAYSDTWNHG